MSGVVSEKTILEVIELLKNRAVYDLMCSLRGPDDTSLLDLKYLFTSRIRALLGVEEAGISRRKEKEVEWRWVESAFNEMVEAKEWSAVWHYIEHVKRALDALSTVDAFQDEANKLYRLASELYQQASNVRHMRLPKDIALKELEKLCRGLGFVRFEEGEE
ncbi:MAG: hypothetical protein ACXQTI_02735 [Candidatus Nezhaarchaeales archaeon]